MVSWRPRGWKTVDTTETIRRVTEMSQTVREEALRTRVAAHQLRQAAAEFVRLDTEALRRAARWQGGTR
jgi:hypothetical protein